MYGLKAWRKIFAYEGSFVDASALGPWSNSITAVYTDSSVRSVAEARIFSHLCLAG